MLGITGATSPVGEAVARLLASDERPCRLLVRNPSHAPSRPARDLVLRRRTRTLISRDGP